MSDIRKFRRSFRYAYEGIKYALATQQNMKFHVFVAFFVLLLALVVQLSKVEIILLLLSVTLVIVTELINTAVEKAVDLAMPDRHPLAKIAKDVAAASVLVSAAFAVVTGLIVFYDPLDRWFRGAQGSSPMTAGVMWVVLGLVALTVTAAQTRFSETRSRAAQPSIITALAFSASTLIALYTTKTFIALLGFGLTVLAALVLYEKKGRSMLSLVFGGAIGGLLTLLSYYIVQWW